MTTMKRRMDILPFEVPALDGTFGSRSLPTDDDLRIASIPDGSGEPAVLGWLDPASKWYSPSSPVGGAWECWRDRTSSQYWIRDGSAAQGSISPGNGLNGNPSIDLDGTTGLFMANSDANLFLCPDDEFSLLIVAATGSPAILFGSFIATADPRNGAYLYISDEGRITTTYGGGGGTAHPNEDALNGVPFLATMTFSADRGVSLRRNGGSEFSNANASTPREPSRIRIASQGTSTEQRLIGSVGHVFVVHADLSRPGYADMLSHIESFMMSASGVTP